MSARAGFRQEGFGGHYRVGAGGDCRTMARKGDDKSFQAERFLTQTMLQTVR